MGALANLQAAATFQTAGNTRKANKLAQAAGQAQGQQLAALAGGLALLVIEQQATNQHLIALVNQQIQTNQLLTQLVAGGNNG